MGFPFLGVALEYKISIVAYIAKNDLLLDDNAMLYLFLVAKLLQSLLHGEKKIKRRHLNCVQF